MKIKLNHRALVIVCILSLLIVSYSYAEPVDTPEETYETTDTMTTAPTDDVMIDDGIESVDTPPEASEVIEVADDAMITEEPVAVSESDSATGEPVRLDSASTIYYTVKKGDTLWDLSRRFNNDSWKWPGMWSDNKQLTNPHRIFPGQKLKLFYRKDIEVIKSIEKQVAADVVEDTSETIEEIPEVIEPEETEKVVDAIEPVTMDETAEAASEPEAPIKLPYYHYSKMDAAGFMRKEPADPHGYIFKVKGTDRLMLSKGDEVYIKETGDIPLTPGAKYFTYKTLEPSYIKEKIDDQKRFFGLKSNVKKSLVGTQHYLTGVIEITGKQSGYAIGRIIKSYKTISLKDNLIPYVYRSPDITLASSIEGLSGIIISSEEQEGKFGDDKIAFIDKGTDDGVKRGQMYNVFYPEEKDSAELIGGDKLFIPVDFASFLVIHAEPSTSTVLITSAYQGVSAGDKWHYPEE